MAALASEKSFDLARSIQPPLNQEGRWQRPFMFAEIVNDLPLAYKGLQGIQISSLTYPSWLLTRDVENIWRVDGNGSCWWLINRKEKEEASGGG